MGGGVHDALRVLVILSFAELMEPPGGTHTTTDLYSKLSADPTIFAKLRIKSEKADA